MIWTFEMIEKIINSVTGSIAVLMTLYFVLKTFHSWLTEK